VQCSKGAPRQAADACVVDYYALWRAEFRMEISVPMGGLTTAQCKTLRSWALSYMIHGRGALRMLPIFRLTSEEKERLHAIARTVPASSRSGWLLLVVIVWVPLVFLMSFLPMVPIIPVLATIASPIQPHNLVVNGMVIMICLGLFVELLLSILVADILATWLVGRITDTVFRIRPLNQTTGDAALYDRIRQRFIFVVVVWFIVVSAVAALPVIATFAIGIA